MSIERAREICRWGQPAAKGEPYLQAQWRRHGNDFLKWWDRRPAPGGEVDIAQFYEMARTTTGVAQELLDSARVVPITSSRLRVPSERADASFAAGMHAQLGEGVVYFEREAPFAIGSPDLPDASMFGALCWQVEDAGLNVVPFGVQQDQDAAFGHTRFDPSGNSNRSSPQVAVHPGLTVIASDGIVITPVELDAVGICGAVMRAGNHMALLTLGAIWSLESEAPDA